MKSALFALFLFGAIGAFAQSDTLSAGVSAYPGQNARVLVGATGALSLLDIRTATIKAAINVSSRPDTLDELLIVKEGELNLTIGDSTFNLDPGGVALLPAGTLCNLEAKQAGFYRLRFRSRRRVDPGAASPRRVAHSGPVILRWADIPVEHTGKGESRQFFISHTPGLSKIDIHATTLNPGEVSHAPHIHRAEEIILMRFGHARMFINGSHYPAAPGDLVFLPSGNAHALENRSTESCTYFALQWEP